jgi:DNA processing protein
MSACDACLRRSNVIATVAPRIESLLQRPGDRIPDILALPDAALIRALTPDERLARTVALVRSFEPRSWRAQADRAGVSMACVHDPRYPPALRERDDAPPVVWFIGRLELLDDSAVAVVGSRRASAYGLQMAEALGRQLAAAGVTVISGMALGIDAAAHRGALAGARPRTVAVLGGGADVVYPRVNRRLYDRIRETGLVLSEQPPGRRPYRWTFPARNRIMAALAEMTVVVEAARPSGSLITSDFAADFGRSVGAVPGHATDPGAAGTNALLADGAVVVRDAGDVLDHLFGAGFRDRHDGGELALTEDEQRVLDAVARGVGPGAIGEVCGLASSGVRAALGTLELAGLIVRTGIGSYERSANRFP